MACTMREAGYRANVLYGGYIRSGHFTRPSTVCRPPLPKMKEQFSLNNAKLLSRFH